MNSESNSREFEVTAEQLELATRRKLPHAAALDEQTAALREAFMHMGRAVESASSGFDEAAMVARLVQHCREEPIRPASRQPQANNRWQVALASALAAAALVAIVRIAATWPEDGVVISAPPPAAPVEPTVDGPAYDFAVIGGGTAQYHMPNVPWSDPLDEEIASAQAAVDQLSGRATGLDGSLDKFGSRLEALSAEMESGSL